MYFLAGCILHKQPILILDDTIWKPYGYNLKDTYTILPVCHQSYILLLPEKIREARHFQGV